MKAALIARRRRQGGAGFGPNQIVNGTFDTDTSGWTVNNANCVLTWQSGGTMLFESTSYAYAKVTPVLNLGATAKTFRVYFEISSWVSGLINVHVGLGVSGNIVNGNGDYTYDYVGSGLTEFQLRPNGGGTGSFVIDNISVREVL